MPQAAILGSPHKGGQARQSDSVRTPELGGQSKDSFAPRPTVSRLPTPQAPGSLLPGPGEERRSLALSYGLWALSLLGICGIHRVYNRKPFTGFLWLFTFGLCGIGQLVDLLLIPGMVENANRERAFTAGSRAGPQPIDRQLLRLARQAGEKGFTINDALIDLDLPNQMDSLSLQQEIDKLLHVHLLDVGNDERGRVVYREP